jgi:hypothetical protein
MKRFSVRFLCVMAAALGSVFFIGCENGGGGGGDSSSSETASSDSVQLTSGRLEIAAGGTAQSSIVTAPAAGVISVDVSVPEDHVNITAWLEDSDTPGSQYDRKTGPALTLSAVTTSGKHWRMIVQNGNATLLHANFTISHQP